MCIQRVLLAEAFVCMRWKTCLERWDPVSLVPYNKHKHSREKNKTCKKDKTMGFTQLFLEMEDKFSPALPSEAVCL